ncbi:unnamed protein product [Sphenostylis stenocarpa]|uniref:Uncharacterized protein n=1 Tax=Sphenostylis stenocarpa TaxID=92480 RepID=A0AA86VYC0_9FABA|nr:unnamed protein product [Sphenostylis stenocarpa]
MAIQWSGKRVEISSEVGYGNINEEYMEKVKKKVSKAEKKMMVEKANIEKEEVIGCVGCHSLIDYIWPCEKPKAKKFDTKF